LEAHFFHSPLADITLENDMSVFHEHQVLTYNFTVPMGMETRIYQWVALCGPYHVHSYVDREDFCNENDILPCFLQSTTSTTEDTTTVFNMSTELTTMVEATTHHLKSTEDIFRNLEHLTASTNSQNLSTSESVTASSSTTGKMSTFLDGPKIFETEKNMDIPSSTSATKFDEKTTKSLEPITFTDYHIKVSSTTDKIYATTVPIESTNYERKVTELAKTNVIVRVSKNSKSKLAKILMEHADTVNKMSITTEMPIVVVDATKSNTVGQSEGSDLSKFVKQVVVLQFAIVVSVLMLTILVVMLLLYRELRQNENMYEPQQESYSLSYLK